MKKIALKVGMAAVLLASAAQANAQNDIIQQLFDKAAEIYKGKGYTETGWQMRGELKQGGEVSYQVKLTGGTQYSIVGMCDTDCSNFDAYLTDSSGKAVDSDTQEDDFPIVAAAASGTYTIRLVMVACKSSPCAYGVKSFKQ